MSDGYFPETSADNDAVIRAQLLSHGSFTPEGGAATHLPKEKVKVRAALQVGDNIMFPDQLFYFQSDHDGGFVQSEPSPPLPNVRISLKPETLGRIGISHSDRTVEASVLKTRLEYGLTTYPQCSLVNSAGHSFLELLVEPLADQDFESLMFQARIYRKLRFIETQFGVSFTLPKAFCANDVSNIEIAFRAITEGEFWSRREELILFDSLVADDPILTGPGQFSRRFHDPHFEVLGRSLLLGPHSITLERAAVADPKDINSFHVGAHQPQGVRIVIFDSQINYRFENYVRRSAQMRRMPLEQFKLNLLKDEPDELADTIEELLISDVSQERARQIVTGWLQFHDFPDRYCPQDPELDGQSWRVPIWVTYANQSGAWVQDAFVDLKTGVLTSPVSPEELRRIGKATASKLLRVV